MSTEGATGRRPERKVTTFPAAFKIGDGPGAGTFSGLASTYSRDLQDDVIVPGAFANTLPTFLASRAFLLWGHSQQNPPIGIIHEAKETAAGLYIAGAFHGTDRAQEIRQVAQERLASALPLGLSIGYTPVRFRYGKSPDGDGTQLRYLERLDLFEVSAVATPANPEATLGSVKHGPGAEPYRQLWLRLERLRARTAPPPGRSSDQERLRAESARLLARVRAL